MRHPNPDRREASEYPGRLRKPVRTTHTTPIRSTAPCRKAIDRMNRLSSSGAHQKRVVHHSKKSTEVRAELTHTPRRFGDTQTLCASTRSGIAGIARISATRKHPADLTGEQSTSLAEVAATNSTLYRACLLKEQLREVFRVNGDQGSTGLPVNNARACKDSFKPFHSFALAG